LLKSVTGVQNISISENLYLTAKKFLDAHKKELDERAIKTVSQLFQEALIHFIEVYRQPIVT